MAKEEPTHQPARVVVGHCPKCLEVCVIFNNYEAWPPFVCKCGQGGATTQLLNKVRHERKGVITDIYHPSERGG